MTTLERKNGIINIAYNSIGELHTPTKENVSYDTGAPPSPDETPAEAPPGEGNSGESSADAVDELQQHLGGYGRYQILVFFLLSLTYMRGGWHVWIPIYQTWEPAYHCQAAPGLGLNDSVPWDLQDGAVVYSTCEQYVNKSVSNATTACTNGWVYMWDSPYTSIVSQFDLVCDHTYQNGLTTTLYMVGTTCGVIFLTPLADRFGSKTVMLVCLWVQAVFATCLIWAGNIVVFCVFKFFIGMCNMTVALCVFVLMSETFDATHRAVPTIAMQFFWAVGIMSMALLGYLIPRWEDLELTIALPFNILSLAYIFIIPNSLPWLLAKGKVSEAESVINKFTRINRLPAVPDLQNKLAKFKREKSKEPASKLSREQTNPAFSNTTENGTDAMKKPAHDNEIQIEKEKVHHTGSQADQATDQAVYTVLTLFKTPRLRIHSLIMFYLFLVNALAYFGIMYSTPELNGDRFFNLFLLGVVEIPAYIICIFSNKIIGRRRSISIFLFICAVTNLAVIFIPDESADGTDLKKLKTALVIIGKFGITGSYSAIYLYASEVFPTVIRNQAVGASSFFENIGSIAAPNMVYVNNSLNNLPLGIFGGMTILGCGLVLLLPETHNHPLPQTIDDVEKSATRAATTDTQQ
ncbi:solute carrier family 22 member 21-like isoform X2 [Physella acuta]|uniref:solute carrier family 22 member 21-like isoform X2 n=1 Tax=Physella acuta TaxID=109671 RepID=UPI0027DE483E|nr:solute carrier family 22 member 21-like isoform X2 [Physella acuta]